MRVKLNRSLVRLVSGNDTAIAVNFQNLILTFGIRRGGSGYSPLCCLSTGITFPCGFSRIDSVYLSNINFCKHWREISRIFSPLVILKTRKRIKCGVGCWAIPQVSAARLEIEKKFWRLPPFSGQKQSNRTINDVRYAKPEVGNPLWWLPNWKYQYISL